MQQHHAGAFATVAFGWVQHHPGEWDRWLVRRCSQCHHIDWVKLIWVDADCMTCLYCLSQDVELDERSDPLSCVCNDCGARSQLDIDDLEDEDEDPDEQEWEGR